MTSGVLRVLGTLLRVFLHTLGRIIFGIKHLSSQRTTVPPCLNPLVKENATTLAHMIRTKKVKSEEVVKAFIDRTKVVNVHVNALVQDRFKEALEEAREVDRHVRSGQYNEKEFAKLKPFYGVPFTIKDFHAVKGLKHTCGMWPRRNVVATEDAECVRLMKKAGAILLGVTNVPELCMWWETYNTIYGVTRNPYDTRRMPGGSSGGEGSLVSSCGSAMGIGSDIAGSIRMPSFYNGLFGHKPTSGIVSNVGCEPQLLGTHNVLSVTGPICRSAKDLGPMIEVLAGDNAHLLSLDKQVNVKELKIYYMEDDGGNSLVTPVDAEVKARMHQVLRYLGKNLGVEPVKVNIPQMSNANGILFSKLGAEKDAHSMSVDLTNREGDLSPWREMVKSVFGQSKHTLPLICLAAFTSFFNRFSDTEKNLKDCESLKLEIKTLLGDTGVLLYPTQPTTAPYIYQTLFMPCNIAYTGIVNMMEAPSTHCPLGLSSQKLPLGIQVIASKYQDHLCLAVAREIEEAFGGWVDPGQQ